MSETSGPIETPEPEAAAPPPEPAAATPAGEPPAASSKPPEPGAGSSLLPLLVVGLLVVIGLLVSGIGTGQGDGAASLEQLKANGRETLARGGPQEALPFFRRAHELAPDDPETNGMLAEALSLLGREKEALPFATTARDKAPGEARYHHLLGMILIELRQLDEARAPLLEALRLKPEDPGPRFRLAVAAMVKQDFALAAKEAQAYLDHERIKGKDPMALKLYADALELQGEHAASIAAQESMCALLPRDLGLRRAVDAKRIDTEGWAAVTEEARKAAEAPGAGAPELFRHARLLRLDPRTYTEARALLEKAVELERTSSEQPRLVDPLLALAKDALRTGQHEQARLLVEEVLQLDPANTEALYVRGAALRSAGKPAEARAELERVLGDPGQAYRARFELLGTFLDEGRAEEALGFARAQVERQPPAHPFQRILAEAQSRTGAFADAAATLERHRDALPEGQLRAIIDSRLAEVWLEAGDGDQARAAFERALTGLGTIARRPPDLLLWAGVAALPIDRARAEALWTEAAEKGLERVPEALSTWSCRRLLARAERAELEAAVAVGSLDEENDGAFIEGLALELAGDRAGARAAYQACLARSKNAEFPARLAEARLQSLPE